MDHNDAARRAAQRKYNQTGTKDDYKAWMYLNCLRIGHSVHQDVEASHMHCVRCGETQKARFIYIRRVGDYAIIDTQTLLFRTIASDSPYQTWAYTVEHNRDEMTIVPWQWHSLGDMVLSTLLAETVRNPFILSIIDSFHGKCHLSFEHDERFRCKACGFIGSKMK
jgi:predicted RNA-binding Zn-ribbon protein involved in translation (DUF1610 family)